MCQNLKENSGTKGLICYVLRAARGIIILPFSLNNARVIHRALKFKYPSW
jgi:hypothetical protein